MIKVYDSVLPCEPKEVYDDHGMTVDAWMAERAPNYQPGAVQPVSVSVNGSIVKPTAWADTFIGEHDVVEVRVLPRGFVGDFFSGIAGFLINPFFSGSLFAADAALKALIDIPSLNQNSSGSQGSRIEPVDARANTARPGAVIPERFGRFICYPDYLTQPRRYYKGSTTQALDLTLCIGTGEFDIDPDTIKIGDTKVSDLGSVVTYSIHQPGATIPTAYGNWYPSPEVGASTGSAGLRLKGYPSEAFDYTDTSATTSGATISAISPPEAWKTGTALSIDIYQSVTITDGGASADLLEGNFEHLNVLDPVFIRDESGSFNGATPYFAQVATINAAKTQITLETTGGVPAPITDLPIGTFTLSVFVPSTAYEIASVAATSLSVSASRSGSPVGTPFPSATGATVNIRVDVDQFDELWAGPFAATPAGEGSGLFEVDIFMPQGLGEIAGSGVNYRTREIEIQWKNRASTSTTWETATRVIEGGTRDQLGFTFPIVTASSAYEPIVRIRRLDAEDLATTSLDRIEWTALRAQLPRADSYSGVTTMTMTIEGSDKISNNSENQVNLIATRKLEPLAGGTAVATRGIAEAAAYIARSTGYDDDQIDIAELTRLGGIWTTRGDTFDHVFGEVTSKQALDTALRAGFAESTIDTGVIKPVRDEPRTTFEQPYSPENMTSPLRRTFEAVQVDEPDGVEVEYTDGDTWTKETVLCLLPGDSGFKLDKIRLEGVTDRTRAWRIGMRRRRAQRYRRWTYNFETELDALNSQYLSYVPLLDDIPGYGKVAILTSISADRITVSEPLEWTAGESHVVAYRDEDGRTVGPFPATQGPDDYTVLVAIPEPWPAVLPSDREVTHVYFGTTARWNFPALITEISPNGSLTVGVTATNYDERVYSDDDNSPP